MHSFIILNKSMIASEIKLFFFVKWVGRVNDTCNELISSFQMWRWRVKKIILEVLGFVPEVTGSTHILLSRESK